MYKNIRDKKGRIKKGNIPWNKGKKGLQIAWNKGLTKETDKRVKKYTLSSTKSRIGKKHTEEQKEKIRKSLLGRIPWNKGIPISEKTKKKLSKINLGKNNHFYGKKHSKESKLRMSISRTGKNSGKDHFRYKGDYLEKSKGEIINLYELGFSTNYLGEKYNLSGPTIGKYLKKWGISLKPAIYGFKGSIISKNGHKVRSHYEVKIDNFLSSSNINHETNKQIIKGKQYLCDFYLPDHKLYIEYWGLERFPNYIKRKTKKLKLYKKLKLKLLEIYPRENIIKKLSERLL